MVKNILKIITVSFFVGVVIFASQDKITWKKAFIKEKPKKLLSGNLIETIELADTIMLHQNEKNIFLDVRTKKYYDYAHIPNAINLPFYELNSIPDETIKKLNNAPNVVLYCVSTSCGVSYRATRMLMDKGVNNIKVYSGGWGEWKSCKLPVSKTKNDGKN